MAEIVLDKVRKEFAAGVVAANDVELTIGDGEFMVLVGPSGCGKTTLLRSIGGRDGFLQQVDAPQRLYEKPTNLFVGAFIGSPSMNLVPGTVSDDTLAIGDLRITLDRDRRPPRDGQVVVGVRPEAFEDAAFADSGQPQTNVRVDVVEELGSDTYVFFALDVEPIVIEEAVSNEKEEDSATLAAADRNLFVARVNARTRARAGEPLTLAIDPSQLYFFSPDTGESLLGGRAAVTSAV